MTDRGEERDQTRHWWAVVRRVIRSHASLVSECWYQSWFMLHSCFPEHKSAVNVEGLWTLPPWDPLCVCIIGSYTPLPSSVLIIDDLFFLSVFFSFHYPLWHYFCSMKKIICSAQSLMKTSFPITCLATAWIQILRVQWGVDETLFWVNLIIVVIYMLLWLTGGFIFNSV